MMMLSRRSFLLGSAAVAALALIPVGPDTHDGMLVLWGDGEHNDGPAMRAYRDGEAVWHARTQRVLRHNGVMFIPQGTYRMDTSLLLA